MSSRPDQRAQGVSFPRRAVPPLGLRLLFACTWSLSRWGRAHMGAPWWRCYWNPEPGMVIHSDDQQLELDGHRLALIPPHTDFSGELRRPCRHFTFPFTLNEAYSLRRGAVYAFDLDGRPSPAELQSRLAPLADASVQAGAHVPPGLALFINGLITAALARIPSADWADGPVDPRVAAAQARLRQACTAPPSNDELAAQAGLHRASFIRLFKAHAGVTPQRYALRLRLEGACEELLLNQSPVEAVASRWGFSDRQHLTKLMRQHCHCTPGSLRQALL